MHNVQTQRLLQALDLDMCKHVKAGLQTSLQAAYDGRHLQSLTHMCFCRSDTNNPS
jgi:hypothetical protein